MLPVQVQQQLAGYSTYDVLNDTLHAIKRAALHTDWT